MGSDKSQTPVRRSTRLKKSVAEGDSAKASPQKKKEQPTPKKNMNQTTADAKDDAMDMDEPPVGEDKENKKQPTEAEVEALLLTDLKEHVSLIERAVVTKESRFLSRVLRYLSSIRKRMTPSSLTKAIEVHLAKGSTFKSTMLQHLGDGSMEMESDAQEGADGTLPEVEVYFGILVLVHLLDSKQYEKGMKLSTDIVQYVHSQNRRSMDQLSGKAYFYYARFYEVTGKLSDIRGFLFDAQRTATLRHDVDSQATILNLLLRNFLHYNLYEQADKLIAKTNFPESVGNNQVARYMYYLGRIKAIQLDYTSSHRHLLQAIRKTPKNYATAGFQQAAQKLSIIVQLLMGEIPERSIFREKVLRKALVPYLHLTQAVRTGNIAKFQETLAQYNATFRADKTYTLIVRLHHNVIKAGIRMISLSYTRISIKDICTKLCLESVIDAEYIIAKAIRDGVIDATIDHEGGFMKSKEIIDIYSTNEPLKAFHQRIGFCLEMNNECVKALRFPSTKKSSDLEKAAERDLQEKELAKEIEEGDFMDEDDDDFDI